MVGLMLAKNQGMLLCDQSRLESQSIYAQFPAVLPMCSATETCLVIFGCDAPEKLFNGSPGTS